MRARSVSTLNAGYAAALQMNSPIAEHLQQSLGLDLTPQARHEPQRLGPSTGVFAARVQCQ
jgi:hypothetical protein